MVFNFVSYVKNRKIGSTYPSIDTKPESSAKRFFKKFRASLAQKCAAVVDSMPFIRPRSSTGLCNIVELQGMSHLCQSTFIQFVPLVFSLNVLISPQPNSTFEWWNPLKSIYRSWLSFWYHPPLLNKFRKNTLQWANNFCTTNIKNLVLRYPRRKEQMPFKSHIFGVSRQAFCGVCRSPVSNWFNLFLADIYSWPVRTNVSFFQINLRKEILNVFPLHRINITFPSHSLNIILHIGVVVSFNLPPSQSILFSIC